MSIKNENSPKASSKQSLVGLAKSVLVEQHQRLSYKNNVELEILEDLYKFMKSRCQIETHYNQQMVKLAGHHLQRKQVSLKTDPNSETKAFYPAWRGYLGQMERCSKDRLAHFEKMISVVDQLKQLKTHKHQVVKKTMDTYFKKSQDDVIASLSEIDKCRKLYFDEEHYAHLARNKEEKIKKGKLGILSKFTDMQSKKEKSSAQKEASEIQSTMARNEYILALASGNAHLQHYFNVELTYLLEILEDNTIDNCKDILIQLIDKEEKCQSASASALKECLDYLNKVTAAYTHLAFLSDGTNTSLSERLQIDFEPCENDTQADISLEHNAAFALEHEVTKWITCFSKETRNLVKIDQQLTKCFKLQSAGKKTVEVNGIGQMDLEQRIEDLKLQKRKCDLNKCKAKARLVVLKKGGLNVDDLDVIEQQITNELEEQLEKQQKDKQMLTVNQGDGEALSRTPSLRSTTVSSDLGRISVMENKSQSDDLRQEFNDTPEPISSENDLSEDQQAQYQQQQASWAEYDVSAAWADPVNEQIDQAQYNQQYEEDYSNQDYQDQTNPQDMVNQYVQAIYPYTAQNDDELDMEEGEQLLVINADEKDWIKVQNSSEKQGFVPFAYVGLATNQQQQSDSNLQDNLADSQYSDSVVQSSPVPYYSEETSYTNQQYAYQEENYQDPTITQESYQETYTASEADQPIEEEDRAGSKQEDDKNYAIAAYDYEADNDEEISFKEGDRILILEKSDDGFWVGTNQEGQTGHFPSMLVHFDDEEIEFNDEEDEEIDSTAELPNFEPPTLPPMPDLPPPPTLPPLDDDEEEEEEEEENSNNQQEEKISKPTSFLTQPDTGIVITEPTPEVEHKPIVEEVIEEVKEEEEEEKEEEKDEEIKEKSEPTVKQNYVPTTVEINVFESEKQVFSSDEEDEPVKEDLTKENKDDEDKNEELPAPPPESIDSEQNVKVKVELNMTSDDNNESNELPPPPPELGLYSPDDDKEDDELIIRRLKQLKDTNNNFTASFDILDDSELTTAENSQSLEEKPENDSSNETKEEKDLEKDSEKDKEETTQESKEENKAESKEESKEGEQASSGFGNFEANFEANFPEEDEDMK